jgi:acrylyl-CoA reductase (NADPH)
MATGFTALWATEADGKAKVALRELGEAELPDGEVTVRVAYSAVNYKDGLAVMGNKSRIMRRLPMAPGIDYAGTVEASDSADFKPGDEVVLTGWGVGEAHSGGFATRTRAKAGWLVKRPDGLSLKQCMAIGTAGFTAMLSVLALEAHGVAPGEHEVLVTGAGGGVGGVAVAVLARLGYKVAALTGRAALADYLTGLGAASIVPRADYAEAGRPLASERWAGAVDTVGSQVLANVLAATRYGGTVAACGLAGGFDLPVTVMPFILRGVTLAGIESVYCPMPKRLEAWQRLAADLPLDKLDAMTTVRPLADVPEIAAAILKGEVRGRTVIDLSA